MGEEYPAIDYIQVVTVVGTRAEAQAIADALVTRRLASCVQVVGPIASTYWWQGQIERAEEWMCVIKSREDLYPAVERTIRENHSYETPEILAAPVVKGDAAYLAWLEENLVK